MTLLGKSEENGHLEGYGPIDADTARDLAGRATSFTRILTHPETAVVLSVGRRRYSVPADLKSWLRLRDETCRFPGCGRRAERCDIDHIAPWQHGGTTDHDNLIHLCRHHHRIKHETGWSVARQDEDDRPGIGGVRAASRTPADAFARPDVVTWTSPAGRRYDDHPALPRLSAAVLPRPAGASPPLLAAASLPRPAAASLRLPPELARSFGPGGLTPSEGGSAASDAVGRTRAVAPPGPFPDEPPF